MPASHAALATSSEPTEWMYGTHLLHRVDPGHYMLVGPEMDGDEPPTWLADHGITDNWFCEWETVDRQLVTHFRYAV